MLRIFTDFNKLSSGYILALMSPEHMISDSSSRNTLATFICLILLDGAVDLFLSNGLLLPVDLNPPLPELAYILLLNKNEHFGS